jgi:phosphoglycerate dehydrogenase-like enzyme
VRHLSVLFDWALAASNVLPREECAGFPYKCIQRNGAGYSHCLKAAAKRVSGVATTKKQFNTETKLYSSIMLLLISRPNAPALPVRKEKI